MKRTFPFLCLGLMFLGCDDSETAETIEYVNLMIEAPGENEGGAVTMTSATCSSNADSGFFEGIFTADDGSMLEVKIKGFSTEGSQYQCSQASDNTAGEVGNKFDQCSVGLTIPSGSGSVNTYAMHRRGTEIKDFEYTGDCSVSINYQEPTVTGTITCSGLIQVDLEGAPRNPIDPSVTASIAGESKFFCDI